MTNLALILYNDKECHLGPLMYHCVVPLTVLISFRK